MIARRMSLTLALLALAGCGANGGGGRCGGGARSTLSAWAEQEQLIGAAFSLKGAHEGGEWRIVLVHEGHVTWRGTARAGADGALKVLRRLDDYPGADRIAVRAYGPSGATCAAATRLSSGKPDRLSHDL
jgi:hypothetical protein